MASITSTTGLGTGLDISAIVSQIVAAERAPVTSLLDRREGTLQARLSAFGVLKSSLSAFQTSLASLKTVSTFQNKSVSSSDEDILTATTASTVAAGTYDISITKRAVSHKLSTDSTLLGAQFTSEADTIGTGTLTFKFGTTDYVADPESYNSFVQNPDKASVDIEITDGSLKGVRDAINNADIGVTAAIVFDGSYYNLTLVSDTGVDNSMEIIVDDDDLADTDTSGLSLLTFSSASTRLIQNDAGLDADLTLNGLNIKSETNSITTAVDGLTINLLADTGSATLTVADDTGTVSSNISNFVAKYNALISTINDLSQYNPETEQAGLLNGDSILRSITSQIRRTISNPVDGLTGAATILADIGISTSSSDGTLVLDNTKLDAAMKSNLHDVISLFSAIGTPTDSLIEYVDSTDLTQVNDFAINITQVATQGTYNGGSTVADLVIDSGVDDTLTLSVDGVATTITLTAQTYGSATALAAEIQARINSATDFLDAGVSASVTADGGGVLTITSNSYGSDSVIAVSGGNGLTGIFGSSPGSTAGLDVAGTIGGYEATGEGQTLTGTQAASGLEIKVTGGATGDRGTISFTRGYAQQLDDVLTELLDSEGLFTTVTDGLNSGIKGIGVERESLERRLATIEERVRSQFIALELLVVNLRSTSDFLTQQLDSLPKIQVRNGNN